MSQELENTVFKYTYMSIMSKCRLHIIVSFICLYFPFIPSLNFVILLLLELY